MLRLFIQLALLMHGTWYKEFDERKFDFLKTLIAV